jgi:hypothetical protein
MGCNAILGNEDGVLATDAGSTADTTQPLDARPDTLADVSLDVAPDAFTCPDAGPPVDAAPTLCTGGVVYVSPSGDDGRDGCTPCTAKQTIGGALASITAATAGDSDAGDAGHADAGHDAGDGGTFPVGMAIHVCAGTFAEPALALTIPVSLMGGYACDTWARTTTYGYPTFDGTNETIVTVATSQLDADAFRVAGADIDSTVVLDGLTFKGTSSSTAGRASLVVGTGASPVISNDQLLGGSASVATGSSAASTGVSIVSGAAPEITRDSIDGGSGVATGSVQTGSIGIVVSNGSPRIHDATVRGGSGHGPAWGSVAIVDAANGVLTSAAGAAIRSNVIDGGTGVATQSGANWTTGISVAGTADILQNRIFAGASTGSSRAVGILDGGTGGSTIANNMILAGPDPDARPIVLQSAGPLVAFNTVFGGATSDTSFVGQINVVGFQEAVVQNNILLGNGVENSAGIVVDACNSDVATIENNAFGNNYHGTYAVNGAGSGCYANWTSGNGQAVSAMQTSLMAIGVTTNGNIGLESDCTTGQTFCTHVASCTNVPGPGADAGSDPTAACLTELIAMWTVADQGKADLLDGGLTLPATDPCPLLNAGRALSAVTDDLFGTARPSMGSISIGAYQIPTQPASCP